MTPQKAIEHFHWKLKNSWKPTKADIEAFNSVKNYVSKKENQQLIDNQLFGKLYIYLFGEFVNYYKATAMDSIPQKELNKLLSKPLKQIVEEVKDRLNYSELEYCIKKTESIKDYSPLEYNDVAENMRVMVNGALNTFNE